MLARKIIVGMIGMVLVLVNGAAFGTTYYVDPNGSDDANGLSWATAFATIGKGITTASGGDAVEVNEGTYYETINYAGKAITVRSTDANDWDVVAATIIDANDPCSAYGVTFDSGEDANSVLRGFMVTGAAIGVFVDDCSPVVMRCILQGNGIGLEYKDTGADCKILNSIIRDNTNEGIFASKGNAEIKNNLVYNNGRGMKLTNASATICNNTVVSNEAYGIEKSGGAGQLTISNCIIWDCNDDLQRCSATYSCIQDGDAGTGNISSDPCFVDDANDDYHIWRKSACVDAGDPCYSPEDETDIDGNARLRGTAVDMGADEDPVVYVKKGATGTTGGSWNDTDAYGELSEALADPARQLGDVIWVARGVYKPGSLRTDTFLVDEAEMEIYGGFPPCGDDDTRNWVMSDRDPAMYETILSGDIGAEGDKSDNCYHVVKVASSVAGTVIDGFTITGGNADGSWPDDQGGGMRCEGSDAIIANCVVIENYAADDGGGVMDKVSGGKVTINNCVFAENQAGGSGGGLMGVSYDLSVTGCVFVGNEAVGNGGGMRDSTFNGAYVTNCTFSDNTAGGNGGGIYCGHISQAKIKNSIFWRNYADGSGDEIYYLVTQPIVNYCNVRGGYSGTGNSSADPKFADDDNFAGWDEVFRTFDDGLRLRPDSGCVDTGSNGAIESTGVERDVIGIGRTINVTVDRGAYELAKIWYVDGSVTGGSNNGTSWGDAYVELRDAISYVNGLTGDKDGNEIWVADGTYKPCEEYDPPPWGFCDVTDSFKLISGVPLRGGFAGYDEPDPCFQDPEIHETILSGNIDTGGSNDCEQVVEGYGRSVLEGFTVTGTSRGTGIFYYDKGSLQVSRCVVKYNNQCIAGASGGGVLFVDDAALRMSSCVILGNDATLYGGGIYSYGLLLDISRCVIKNNEAVNEDGGGIFVGTNEVARIRDCFFIGNDADEDGGAMCNIGTADMEITNCVFSGNHADEYGGAIYNSGRSPSVNRCTFRGNTASYYGDAIANSGSTAQPTISNCILWDSGYYEIDSFGGSPGPLFVTHCDVRGGYSESGVPTAKIINVDPIFADTTDLEGPDGILGTGDDGLCIASFSPCVDAGTCVVRPYCEADASPWSYIDTLEVKEGTETILSNDSGYEEGEGYWDYTELSAEMEPETNYGVTVTNGYYDEGMVHCLVWVDWNQDGDFDDAGEQITLSGNPHPYTFTGTITPPSGALCGYTRMRVRIINQFPSEYPPLSPCGYDWAQGKHYFGEVEDYTVIVVASGGGGGELTEPRDITGRAPVDALAENTGIGKPPIDIGAYESPLVWYVDDATGCTSGCDGSTWEKAFDDVQDALDTGLNTELAAGDEIWVAGHADGYTYKPTTTSDREASFELVEGVTLYGGFPPNGNDSGNAWGMVDRDARVYETILSGDIGGGYYSYHVATGADNGILDGFTITGGKADGTYPYNIGGGIYCSGVSPKIGNCVIKDNEASMYGGGIFNWNCNPKFTGCFILDNEAVRGGSGVYNESAHAKFANCVFLGNRADALKSRGAGMYNCSNSDPVMVNCTFSMNKAGGDGGGVYSMSSSDSPKVRNCIFWGNEDSGGMDESAQIHGGMPVVDYSCIQGGWSGSGGNNIDDDPCFLNPISYWKFDDGEGSTIAEDCSAGGNDGTLHGSPVWVSGSGAKVGSYALDLNGSEDYVSVPTNRLDQTEGSFALWIRPDFASTTSTTYYIGGMKKDAGNQLVFYYDTTLDKFAFGKNFCGTWYYAYAPYVDFSEDQWIHVAFCWHYTNGMDAYADGVAGTSNENTSLTAMASTWVMGMNPSGGNYFDGTIDEALIFDRALSETEVGQLYASGSNGDAYDLAAGLDSVLGTVADGLYFQTYYWGYVGYTQSLCVDVGNNSALDVPGVGLIRQDICGSERVKEYYYYDVDMGAYEWGD